MTVLSLLGGDWEYQFEDEITTGGGATAGTRMIKYNSGGVITTNELYTAIVGATDEFQAMGFKNPIKPVTPNQFTLENQAFISRNSTEWLKEGTLVCNWTSVTSPDSDGNGVIKVAYTESTAYDSADIGCLCTQTGTGHTGTILDYEVEPDGTKILWIRPTVSGTDTFSGTGALSTSGSADGAASASVAGVNGSTTYTAIQAIGSVSTATEVYIVQNRIKLANSVSNTHLASTNGFQFWSTDQAAALGIISVLIRTESAGEIIADSDLEVFARKYGSLYDNFRLRVDAGGFSALPLASAPDLNNTTGYYKMTSSAGSEAEFLAGNAIYQGASWATATSKGIITKTVTGANPTVEYYMIGDLEPFLTGANTVTEYKINDATPGDGDGTITTVVAAQVANDDGPLDSGAGEGGTVTIDIGHTVYDHDNTGTAEPYSITIDCQGDVPIAKVYEKIKYVCRRGSDNSFWEGTCSIDGEQYRGLEKTIYYSDPTGTMVEGEDLINETYGGGDKQTMVLMADNASSAGEGVDRDYVTIADVQSSIYQAFAEDNVLGDIGSTDTVQVDLTTSHPVISHSSVKASPFGSFTGTAIFGAAGVYFKNPLTPDDAQAYTLTDDLGSLRSPPNTVTYTVAGCLSQDRVLVGRAVGATGVIDKDLFGGMGVTSASEVTINLAGSIDAEVPQAGYIRIVDTSAMQEHKYWYDSRNLSTNKFNLRVIAAGTAEATTNTTQLTDDEGDFQSATVPVEVGMLIEAGGSGSGTYEVTAVTSGTVLQIQQVFGSGGTFTTGSTYTINETITAYTTDDDIFDLIIDVEAAGTTVSNTFVYGDTPFDTVVQVRHGGDILPFQQNQSCGGDTTVTTVRAEDTIA